MPGAPLIYILHLHLNLYIYTKPWPRIYGLCGVKQVTTTAGDRECGRLLTRSPRPPPFDMNAVNEKRCTGRQCSPVLWLPTGQSLRHSEWC